MEGNPCLLEYYGWYLFLCIMQGLNTQYLFEYSLKNKFTIKEESGGFLWKWEWCNPTHSLASWSLYNRTLLQFSPLSIFRIWTPVGLSWVISCISFNLHGLLCCRLIFNHPTKIWREWGNSKGKGWTAQGWGAGINPLHLNNLSGVSLYSYFQGFCVMYVTF